MIYCSKCGGITKSKYVESDSIKRDVCTICDHINYLNPKIIVGSLPIKNDFILLCKRDISPSKGMWTIPSGYMELGESLEAGAKREAYEEANLEYEIIKLYGTYSIPSIGQVLFVYLGEILNENYRAAAETSEVKLFNINEIPWEDIAFSSVEFFLRKYILDYKDNKNYKFHSNFAQNN
tara:strand:+ start:169 stop:705 length:537 start_codon:yes stop_codon:yes gene_type:complete